METTPADLPCPAANGSQFADLHINDSRTHYSHAFRGQGRYNIATRTTALFTPYTPRKKDPGQGSHTDGDEANQLLASGS